MASMVWISAGLDREVRISMIPTDERTNNLCASSKKITGILFTGLVGSSVFSKQTSCLFFFVLLKPHFRLGLVGGISGLTRVAEDESDDCRIVLVLSYSLSASSLMGSNSQYFSKELCGLEN